MAARHKGSQLLTVVSKDKVAEECNDIAMSTPHANDTNNAQAQERAFESSSLASQHEPAARLAVGNTSGELSKDKNTNEDKPIPTPHCYNMVEHPPAAIERARLNNQIRRIQQDEESPEEHTLDATENGLLSSYISHGLAYTIGSALSRLPPPTQEICLQAFLVPNKAGLTAGARAWSKHAHRSGNTTDTPSGNADDTSASDDALKRSLRWWGTPTGPVARINERAVELFWKVWRGATWRNLHWLPHQVLVYEIRVSEGYGMRWAQDLGRNAESVQILEATSQNVPSLDAVEASVAPSSDSDARNDIPQEDGDSNVKTPVVHALDVPWVFRGFVEPMMDNGHEVGWRH